MNNPPNNSMIKLIECPRDAMQGIHHFIDTNKKVEYINLLLKVGFDTIDFGSFVSAKAIPQMRDTAQVLNGLDLTNTKSKLLAIIANARGAQDACEFQEIDYLGFPFSISETFQHRNTNSSIEESLTRVDDIQDLCMRHKKQLVVYISMAFGNPYGDDWNDDIAIKWTKKLYERGVRIFALSDTIGTSNPESIIALFTSVIPEFPLAEIGAHLHSIPQTRNEKIEAAYNSGCRRFDSAVHGFGGCPMAADNLTGNIATQNIVAFLESKNIQSGLDNILLESAYKKAWEVFPVN